MTGTAWGATDLPVPATAPRAKNRTRGASLACASSFARPSLSDAIPPFTDHYGNQDLLSRGHFIGEIVDALGEISTQSRTRSKLGLIDLNRHAEDFFKEVLNRLYGWSLVNLNEERSNAPGLDLGDESRGIGVQVTSVGTSKKVNDTLARATKQNAYSKIRVLMIAGRQRSYALDEDLCGTLGFQSKHIWDVNTLGKRAMGLPLDELHGLYNYVRTEMTRVRIDLEIPDENGKFPTNLADFAEKIPRPAMSNLKKFNAYLREDGLDEPLETTRAEIERFSNNLAKLPRITREYFQLMVERRETEKRSGMFGHYERINAHKLDRITRYPDAKGELAILKDYGFVDIEEPDEPGQSPFWSLGAPRMASEFFSAIIDFAEKNRIPLGKPLVALDFRDF